MGEEPALVVVVHVAKRQAVQLLAGPAPADVQRQQDRPRQAAPAKADVAHHSEEAQEQEPVDRRVVEHVGIGKLPEGLEPGEPRAWQGGRALASGMLVFVALKHRPGNIDALRVQAREKGARRINSRALAAQDQEYGQAHADVNGDGNQRREQRRDGGRVGAGADARDGGRRRVVERAADSGVIFLVLFGLVSLVRFVSSMPHRILTTGSLRANNSTPAPSMGASHALGPQAVCRWEGGSKIELMRLFNGMCGCCGAEGDRRDDKPFPPCRDFAPQNCAFQSRNAWAERPIGEP